jgi:HJR/Mrr/RecB family endonuclease
MEKTIFILSLLLAMSLTFVFYYWWKLDQCKKNGAVLSELIISIRMLLHQKRYTEASYLANSLFKKPAEVKKINSPKTKP